MHSALLFYYYRTFEFGNSAIELDRWTITTYRKPCAKALKKHARTHTHTHTHTHTQTHNKTGRGWWVWAAICPIVVRQWINSSFTPVNCKTYLISNVIKLSSITDFKSQQGYIGWPPCTVSESRLSLVTRRRTRRQILCLCIHCIATNTLA